MLHNLSRKVSFWCGIRPSSRKENAAEAVPAGCAPTLRFQSQGNGISKVGMKAETKQSQHLTAGTLWSNSCVRQERRRWKKKVFALVKSVWGKKSPVNQVVGGRCSPLDTRRFWGAVSFSQIAQQELPKSFVFTSSKM